MKFNELISESIDKMSLKKVRIKVDPASIGVAEDLAKCNGYEGFVLAEDMTDMKVLVVLPGGGGSTQIFNIPQKYLELMLQNIDNIQIDNFKKFIITSLNIANDDPIIQQIESCFSIDDIEMYLKDRGLTSDDISRLYKYYIL